MAYCRCINPWLMSPARFFLLLIALLDDPSAFVQSLRSQSSFVVRRRIRTSFGRATAAPSQRRVLPALFEKIDDRKSLVDAGRSDDASSSYLATCIPGLSTVLATELEALGCHHVATTSPSGVTFRSSLSEAVRALAWTRTAHRVLEFLCASDSVHDRDSLMSFVQQSVDVKDLLGDGQGGLLTLSVQVVMTGKSREVGAKSSDLTHSKFTALSIKNALCDSVRARRGDRPDVDPDDPDVPLVAFVRDSSVSLYRQLHVGSLHRRGYRSDAAIHKAAMKESLAAGLLMHAGWNDRILAMKEESIEQQPQVVLVDPMAGSGTLVLEAVLMAADVAPGLLRASCSISNPERFPGHLLPPVTRWKHPSGDESAISAAQIWKDELVEASHRAKTGIGWLRSSNSVRFFANDYHPGAIDLIESSLREASQVVPGLDSLVEVHQGDCEDWIPVVTSSDNGKFDSSLDQRWMVVCNPPWGERLSEDMHESWESLRAFLRGGTCPPRTEAWILSGNPAATKHLGLQRSSSLPVRTGQQDLRWLQYEIRDKSPSFSASSFQPSQSRKEKETTAHSVPRVKTSRTERLQKASVANSRKAPAAKFKQDRPNRNRSAASRTNPQPTKRSKSASENEWLI